MRTMMLIAFSLFTMAGCAVDPDEPGDRQGSAEQDHSGRDRWHEVLDERMPVTCTTDAECRAKGDAWACDPETATCVLLDDLPF